MAGYEIDSWDLTFLVLPNLDLKKKKKTSEIDNRHLTTSD